MSQHKPDTSDDADNEPEPDVYLADPDDYHRRERLKEIHQRRQQVHNVAENMDRYNTTGEHERQRASLNDAVSLYIAELEPLIERTEESPELPDGLPWDSVSAFADNMGSYVTEDGDMDGAGYRQAMRVFRECNRYLATVKPLIEDDGSDEWVV